MALPVASLLGVATLTSSRDEAVAVLIEHLESLLDLLSRVSVLHLTSHHGQELREVNGTVAISIDLVHHVLQLCLSGVLYKLQ